MYQHMVKNPAYAWDCAIVLLLLFWVTTWAKSQISVSSKACLVWLALDQVLQRFQEASLLCIELYCRGGVCHSVKSNLR